MLYLPNYAAFSSGNIIPTDWYKKITKKGGASDLPLMSVLSEIVYWYRPTRTKDPVTDNITYVNKFLGDAWQTSYEHFEKKFGFKRERLRRIFVKLEQMGICSREFRTVRLRGQRYNNRLFIHLSVDFLNSCTASSPSPSVASCTADKRKILPCKDNHSSTEPSSLSVIKKEGGSPRVGGDLYRKNKKNFNKDRSTIFTFEKTKEGSNFVKNNLELEENLPELEKSLPEKNLIVQPPLNFTPPTNIHQFLSNSPRKLEKRKPETKTLAEFYPLCQEDGRYLQKMSGREFSLNAMNEILLDMSRRRADPFFHSKKGFLSYMAKAFAYEKRDAVKINNENFKIKANLSPEERRGEEVEKYLEEIEYSQRISPEWHLKKKLACVLEKNKAYSLLKAYKSLHLKGGICQIILNRTVELTQHDKEIILAQIKATHEGIEEKIGQGEENLQSISPIITGQTICKVEYIMPAKDKYNIGDYNKGNKYNCSNENAISEHVKLPNTLWGSIRRQLISIYGQAVDGHWFSKLEAQIDDQIDDQIDEDKKTIMLKAPNDFFKDWIERNYEQAIQTIATAMGVRIHIQG